MSLNLLGLFIKIRRFVEFKVYGFLFFENFFYKCLEIQRIFLNYAGLVWMILCIFWVCNCGFFGYNGVCWVQIFLGLIICWKSIMLEVIATKTILSSILELNLRCSKELPNKRPDIKEVVAKVTKLNWHFFETDILLFSFVIASDYEALVHDKSNITFYSG